ncbi:MAG TPA: hypothetical protein VGE55_11010 [Limnobacter sp.]|uniref:hypothetical protein n=1 Tax=Limnobacter sp. TaxID=2003368 RepID=UPI002ED91CEC
MTQTSLVLPLNHSTTHPNDLEAGRQNNAPTQRATTPAWKTGLKLAGMGLCTVAAAGTLASSLLHSATEVNSRTRKILQDYDDGCGSEWHREHFTDKAKARFKWAFVGEACTAGVGVLLAGAGLALRKTRDPKDFYDFAIIFAALGVSALVVTGIAHGVAQVTDGNCVKDNP